MLNLKDSSLLRQAVPVGTRWIEADPEKDTAVYNPSTGALVGYVPNLGAAETEEAIAVAEEQRHAWAAKTAKARSKVIRRWFELLMENQDEIDKILARGSERAREITAPILRKTYDIVGMVAPVEI